MNPQLQPAACAMAPYTWEPSSQAIARQSGLQEKEVVRFDDNTVPWVLGPVKKALRALAGLPVNRYPVDAYPRLRERLARYVRAGPENVVLAAGSGEALGLVCRAFLFSRARCVTAPPTFAGLAWWARAAGARCATVPRKKGFRLDTDALLRAAAKSALAYVCDPNSPTGNRIPLCERSLLLERASCPLLWDEAYIEFCGKSACPHAVEREGVMVSRTLSKAFGLAGARVGYLVTGEKTACALNALCPPAGVSLASVQLALAALSAAGVREMRKRVAGLLKEKKRFLRGLEEAGCRVFPSHANFLLVRFPRREEDIRALRARGLVVRRLQPPPPGMEAFARVTVRTKKENNRLLEALQERTP